MEYTIIGNKTFNRKVIDHVCAVAACNRFLSTSGERHNSRLLSIEHKTGETREHDVKLYSSVFNFVSYVTEENNND